MIFFNQTTGKLCSHVKSATEYSMPFQPNASALPLYQFTLPGEKAIENGVLPSDSPIAMWEKNDAKIMTVEKTNLFIGNPSIESVTVNGKIVTPDKTEKFILELSAGWHSIHVKKKENKKIEDRNTE